MLYPPSWVLDSLRPPVRCSSTPPGLHLRSPGYLTLPVFYLRNTALPGFFLTLRCLFPKYYLFFRRPGWAVPPTCVPPHRGAAAEGPPLGKYPPLGWYSVAAVQNLLPWSNFAFQAKNIFPLVTLLDSDHQIVRIFPKKFSCFSRVSTWQIGQIHRNLPLEVLRKISHSRIFIHFL